MALLERVDIYPKVVYEQVPLENAAPRRCVKEVGYASTVVASFIGYIGCEIEG